jgi:hypothetical protein
MEIIESSSGPPHNQRSADSPSIRAAGALGMRAAAFVSNPVLSLQSIHHVRSGLVDRAQA